MPALLLGLLLGLLPAPAAWAMALDDFPPSPLPSGCWTRPTCSAVPRLPIWIVA
ncbi:hypothetical protein [Cyanobium sp. ATX-6F1]|uniref:hypothetical protein n=1 Tax=Cyanobium sp. ATX-6F1 TaxID=3137388 RepID=UPI0039BDF3AC